MEHNITPSNTTSDVWFTEKLNLISWLSCLMVLCSVSSLLSAVMFLFYFVNESLRNAIGALTANYLLANLLMTAVNMPIYCISIFRGVSENKVQVNCEHSYFFFMVNTHAIFWAWFFIATHHAAAVFFPFAFRTFPSQKIIVAKMVLTWLVPLMINLPLRLGIGGIYGISNPWGACAVDFRKSRSAYISVLPFLGVYFPAFAVQLIYGAVLLKFAILNRQRRRRVISVKMDSETSPVISESYLMRPAVLRMALSLLYTVCYVTLMLTTIYDPAVFIEYPMLDLWILLLFIAPYLISLVRT